jgi:hypothetical protein
MQVLSKVRKAWKRPTAVGTCIFALRVAPWLAFGPITGVMSERAIHCYRNGERVLAGLYVLANISVLVTIPLLTAMLATQIE